MLNSVDYPALAAVSAVLRLGSFERAAAELGVTPSAISQRIRQLEERVGCVLILRGQPCTGTEAGNRLARHMEEVRLLETALARDLGRNPSLTPIRIAVNADSLATWLPAALAATEGLLFDIVVDDQDHSAEWLRRGEVSAAVTSRADPVQGCEAVPIGSLRYLATASPDFVERWFPDGLTVEAFAAAPAMTFNAKDSLQSRWAEATLGRRVNLPTHYLPSTTAFVDAALLGLGWGLNPEMLIRDHVASGELVTLGGRPMDVPLTWQISRLMGAALSGLTGAIRAAAANGLVQA